MSTRVSVICPAHNRSEAIRPTLASVLGQSVTDWELVVVADGCTDDTAEVAADAARGDRRVTVVRNDGVGHPSPARQLGLARSTAPVVAYLDHDDQWRADHLQVLLALVDSGADVVATGYTAYDDNGTLVRRCRSDELIWHPDRQAMLPLFEPSRVAHRRDTLRDVGGWQVTTGLEDWDLWWRLARAGRRFATAMEPTARILQGQRTRRARLLPTYWAPILMGAAPRDLALLRSQLDLQDVRERLSQAAHADRAQMLCAHLADGAVLPVGAPERVDTGDGERQDELPRGRPLSLVPWQGRYAVAQPLYCSDADHAGVVRQLIARWSPRQRAVLRGLVLDLGLGQRVEVPDEDSAPRPSTHHLLNPCQESLP